MKSFKNFIMTMESNSYPSLPKKLKPVTHAYEHTSIIEIDDIQYEILLSKRDVESLIFNNLKYQNFPLAMLDNDISLLKDYEEHPEYWENDWKEFEKSGGYSVADSDMSSCNTFIVLNGKGYKLEDLNITELVKVYKNRNNITFLEENGSYPKIYAGYIYPEFDSEDVDSHYIFHVEPDLPKEVYEEDYKWVKVGKTMIAVYDKVRNIDFGFKK